MTYRDEYESGAITVRWHPPPRAEIPADKLKQLREITIRQIREAERRRYGAR
jgi:hypothetical protein